MSNAVRRLGGKGGDPVFELQTNFDGGKTHRTRGVLRLMAAVIHSLWERQDGNLLIVPATVPIDDPAVQFELTRYPDDQWTPVIAKDVDGEHSLPLSLDREVPTSVANGRVVVERMALFGVKYLRFMSLICDTGPLGRHEIVISESLSTKEAHKALFCFDDGAYQVVEEGLFDALQKSASDGALKIHVSGGWEWMLCLALWKEGRPARGEVFFLLKTLGLSDDDLRPFTSPDCNDIFHYLYYGQRFDVLRRLCTKARKVSETKIIHTGSIRINCHLVAEETGQIVVSSL